MEPAFVILVALKFNVFSHYCKEPKTFYDSYEEAEEQLKLLVETKQFKQSQLKIQKLWKTTQNN